MKNKCIYKIIYLSLIIVFCGNFACNFKILSYHCLPIFIIISLLIFIVAKNRLELIIFITCYHSISAKNLILGYSTFFKSSFIYGVILITLTSLFFSFLITFLSFNKNKLIQLIFINIFWSIPHFLVGWAAPLFAAGYFMPYLGWYGIVLFIPLIYTINLIKLKYKIYFLLIVFCLTFINIKNNITSSITVINTNFYNNLIKDSFYIYKKFSKNLQYLSKQFNYKNIIIIPEDNFPCFNEEFKYILIKELKKNSIPPILSGSTICSNKKSKSGIIFIHKNKIQFIYVQRQPMPYAMYIPFSLSYKSNWSNNGVIKLNNKKYGLFVCFETVVLWTYLKTLFYKPNYFLSFNSVYWDDTGKVKNMQNQMMYSVSRLFGVLYQGSWNY